MENNPNADKKDDSDIAVYSDSDEIEWYHNKWPVLRDFIVRICRNHCEVVIAEAIDGMITDSSWESFLAAVMRDLSQGGGVSKRRVMAVSLLGEPNELRGAIAESGKFLSVDDTGNHRTAVLRRGLTRVCDARLGGTLYVGKAWKKLDEISRALAASQAPFKRRAVDRCSMDHFIDLAAHIRVNHASDPVPKTIKTIERYFERFCECCAPVSTEKSQISAVDPNFSSNVQIDDDWSYMEWLDGLFNEGELPEIETIYSFLDQCVDSLGDEEKEFVAIKFGQYHIPEMSAAEYCRVNTIDYSRFGRVVRSALQKIEVCLTSKIDSAK